MRGIGIVLTLALLWCFSTQAVAASEEMEITGKSVASPNKRIKEEIRDIIKDRALVSGTLDLYDQGVNRVRNLRFIEFIADIETSQESPYIPVKCRDIHSGEIVTIHAYVNDVDGQWQFENFQIADVMEPKVKIDVTKEYSDDDIRHVIKAYIENQTKFIGHMLVFDQDKGSLRKLEFIDFKGELRKYGVLSISSTNFKDIESEEYLNVDITVKNNDGVLSIDSLKIRGMAP